MTIQLTRLGDVLSAKEHVDDVDALSKAATSPALRTALQWYRPRNWWGCGIEGVRLLAFARKYGVPLASVPRQSIVVELAAAADRAAVASILNHRAAEIVEDCAAELLQCDHRWISEHVHLAHCVIRAYRDGHPETATALAVCLAERLAVWALDPRVSIHESRAEREQWAKRRQSARGKDRLAALELDDAAPGQNSFLSQLLIAPLPRFFTQWRPEQGTPPPAELSRHVVAHQPILTHLTGENAVIAIMLITSILRREQDWCEEVDDGDHR